MTKILVCLLSAMMWVAGAQAQSAEFVFRAPGLRVQQVALQAGERRIELPYDSIRPLRFIFSDFPGGYARLEFGRVQKMIYLERGKTLETDYKRVRGSQDSPYHFSGDLAAENRWLDEHEMLLPVRLSPEMTAKETVGLLQQEAGRKKKEIESRGFTPAFTSLETQRQAFGVYASFRNCRNRDSQLYAFLSEQVKHEESALLPCDVYRTFLLDALFALAGEGKEGYDPYTYADFQLNYISKQLKNKALKGFLASSVIIIYMERRGTDRIEPLLKTARHLLCTSEEKQQVEEVYAKWHAMAKGTPAGEFVFHDLEDKPVALSDFRGNYVFIDCWATWCGPCRKELAPLRQLEHDYAGRGIVFLSISGDDKPDKWKKYVAEQQLGGTQVIDPPGSDFKRRFDVNAIPRFILIDPDGLVYDAMAPRPSEPACRNLLDAVIGGRE